MSELARESLRNVALISSAGAGKTSLAEAMLFASGVVPDLGVLSPKARLSRILSRKSYTDVVPSAPVCSVVPGITPQSISLILLVREPCSARR